jgi:hypothetical protein
MKKVYKKHWASPTRIFNVLELVLITWIGFFLLNFLYDFAAGMQALSEIDKAIRGY